MSDQDKGTPQDRLVSFLEAEPQFAPEDPKKKKGEHQDPEAEGDHEPENEDDLEVEDDIDPEEGTEDDDEDEYDEEDEGADPDEDDDSEGTDLFTVKVDGEEVEVTEEELKKGYSAQAHFTRNMQALRQREAEFEGEIAAVTQERERYSVLLNQLEQHLQTQVSGRTPEQWAELERTDPLGYVTERQKEREAQERMADVQYEQQQAQAKMSEQSQKELLRIRQEEGRKILQAIPEWAKDEVRVKETEQIVGYARELGFTDEEIDKVLDHRLIILLRDAALGHKVKKGKGDLRPKRRGTKSARPGSGKTRRQPKQKRQARKARENLSQSGKIDDAAAAIRHMI
jgi:hypothetical protein